MKKSLSLSLLSLFLCTTKLDSHNRSWLKVILLAGHSIWPRSNQRHRLRLGPCQLSRQTHVRGPVVRIRIPENRMREQRRCFEPHGRRPRWLIGAVDIARAAAVTTAAAGERRHAAIVRLRRGGRRGGELPAAVQELPRPLDACVHRRPVGRHLLGGARGGLGVGRWVRDCAAAAAAAVGGKDSAPAMPRLGARRRDRGRGCARCGAGIMRALVLVVVIAVVVLALRRATLLGLANHFGALEFLLEPEARARQAPLAFVLVPRQAGVPQAGFEEVAVVAPAAVAGEVDGDEGGGGEGGGADDGGDDADEFELALGETRPFGERGGGRHFRAIHMDGNVAG